MKRSEQEVANAIEKVKKIIRPGDTIKTVLRHVSRSGLSRSITMISPDAQNLDYLVAVVTRSILDKKNGGVKIGGCGMDMGFALVYELGARLYPRGDGKSITGRNGSTNPETDGGYLLNQEWL